MSSFPPFAERKTTQLSNFSTKETSDLDLNFKMVHPATRFRELKVGLMGTRRHKCVPWGQLAEACVSSMGWVRWKRNVGVGIKGGRLWSRFVARSGCKEQQSLRSPTYLCLRPAGQGLSRAFTISCPKANVQKAGCRKYTRRKVLGGDCYQRTERRELNGGIGWYRTEGG